jgi:ribosomal-protein-alanine N-acetyltransferase
VSSDDAGTAVPTSARLELTETTETDLSAVVAIWNLPVVRRFLFDDEQVSLIGRLHSCPSMRSYAAAGLGSWSVRRRGGEPIIGTAGLMPASTSAQHEPRLRGLVEPVIAIHPDVQRQGFGREVMDVLPTYAFERLKLGAVAAAVDAPNAPSVRLVEALGFTLLSVVPGPVHQLRTYTLVPVAYRTRAAHSAPDAVG